MEKLKFEIAERMSELQRVKELMLGERIIAPKKN
jgi:hypothetical protein